MPRYKYACKSCKLQDVKRIQYNLDKKPVCAECGEELERSFMRPPQAWFNKTRQGEQ